MSKNNARTEREQYFAIWGVIVGIAIGIFGNIMADYVYDSFKNEPFIVWLVGLSTLFVVTMVVAMGIWMIYLYRKIS